MRLRALLVSTGIVFGTGVFLVAMVPTMVELESALVSAGASSSDQELFDRIETIVLRVAPFLFGLAAILFAYVAIASRQRFVGRGGGRL